MNKVIMVIWGFVISLLLGLILIIGYKQRDNIYLDLSSSLQKSTQKYVLKNNSNIKFNDKIIVFVSDLIDGNYIKEEDKENIEKYCIKSIVYRKGLFEEKYIFNKDCENKE